jgi:hypothetical protein
MITDIYNRPAFAKALAADAGGGQLVPAEIGQGHWLMHFNND